MNSNQCQSPIANLVSVKFGHKTPQPQTSGINKSLLTPCRRMGLKRKSPLATGTAYNSVKRSAQFKDEENVHISPELHESNACTDLQSKDHVTPKRKLVANNIKTEKLSIKLVLENPQSSTESNLKCDTQNEETHPPLFKSNAEESVDKAETVSQSMTEEALVKMQQRIKMKEEKINEMKLAQLYRKKHDLDKLAQLTDTWRRGCQEALLELLHTSCSRGYQVNMVQLLAQLGIPHDLVNYNEDSDEFQ